MRARTAGGVLVAFLSFVPAGVMPSLAAGQAGGQAAEAPADAAARQVFESLGEADRRAIQDALIWTGDYQGIVSGNYGPRTREGIASYLKRKNLPPNALDNAPARARLFAEAAALRKAVGFAPVSDSRAGLRIALPMKLLPKESELPSGSRFAAADGSIVIDTFNGPAGESGLKDLFDKLTAESPTRKIVYKLLKPDFFVISGEARDAKFYGRYALGGPGGGTIHGFTIRYPKDRADRLDPVVLAIAAGFDPFPGTTPAVAGQADKGPAGAGPTPPAKTGYDVLASAVIVGPALALTRLAKDLCPDPRVNGRVATWRMQDQATGLALLDVPGAPSAVAPVVADWPPQADATSLALLPVADAGGSATSLEAAAVAMAPAESGPMIAAPLQRNAAGVPIVDREGRLLAMAGQRPRKSLEIAGTVIAADYPVVPGGAIRAFLGRAGVTSAATPPPGALSAWRGAVATVACARKS